MLSGGCLDVLPPRACTDDDAPPSSRNMLQATTSQFLNRASDHVIPPHEHSSPTGVKAVSQDAHGKAPTKRVRRKTARRREQCRVNQARYRMNQTARDEALRTSVVHLRNEIAQLQAQRLRAQREVGTTTTHARDKAVVLFSALRGGVQLRSSRARARQLALIESTLHENVRVGDARGRTRFVQRLERYTRCWEDVWIRRFHVENSSTHESTTIVHVTALAEATVTSQTICNVFPHLTAASHRHLRRKLVHQRLLCNLACWAVFNEATEIVQIDWTVDLVDALLSVLKLSEIPLVLDQARLE